MLSDVITSGYHLSTYLINTHPIPPPRIIIPNASPAMAPVQGETFSPKHSFIVQLVPSWDDTKYTKYFYREIFVGSGTYCLLTCFVAFKLSGHIACLDISGNFLKRILVDIWPHFRWLLLTYFMLLRHIIFLANVLPGPWWWSRREAVLPPQQSWDCRWHRGAECWRRRGCYS